MNYHCHGYWHRSISYRFTLRTLVGVNDLIRTHAASYLAVLLLTILLQRQSSWAASLRVIHQGARAAGQGLAFAAQADDPSAIYYNPAGMSQISGNQLSFGTTFLAGATKFQSEAGQTTYMDFDGPFVRPPPSTFYAIGSCRTCESETLSNSTFGVGVLPPYGLVLDYDDRGPLSNVVTSAALPLLDVKPTFAYRVNDRVSIGAGLDLYSINRNIGTGAAQLKFRAGDQLAQLYQLDPDSELTVRGRDQAAGFNLGLLLTPWFDSDRIPRLNTAFVYRSGFHLDLSGDLTSEQMRLSAAEFTIAFPEVYTVGVAYWPIRNSELEWKLEIDLDYVRCSSVENIDIRLDQGVVLPSPREFQDSAVVMLGTELLLKELPTHNDWDLALRAGYTRAQSPTPDRTFGPVPPEATFHGLGIGVSVIRSPTGELQHNSILDTASDQTQSSKAKHQLYYSIDLAYQLLLYERRHIQDNVNPLVDGLWDTTQHVVMIGMTIGTQ